jgi:hypothetical protein
MASVRSELGFVPADSGALIRSFDSGVDRVASDVKACMLARHRISARQGMYNDQAALDD